jgi:hypothetical protein
MATDSVDPNSRRFEATVAIGHDGHFIDTMGSALIEPGRVALCRRNGETIAEASLNETHAKSSLFRPGVRIWMKGGPYSIEAPKRTQFSLGSQQRLKPSRELTQRFLQAFQDPGWSHREGDLRLAIPARPLT